MSRGFRVWDIEKKEYADLVSATFSLSGELLSTTKKSGRAPVLAENYIVEQDTGLKDKNDKRICEGDIVEWVDGLGEKHIFEIIWNECRASFQMVEIGQMVKIGQEYPYILQGLSDKMKPYCEVIGNIHEDSELLGDEE